MVPGHVLVSREAEQLGLDIAPNVRGRQYRACRATRPCYFDGNVLWREQEKRELAGNQNGD